MANSGKTVHRLRKRAEFLGVRSGKKIRGRLFFIEYRTRNKGEVNDSCPRIGFTVTRKNGNAVIRNRIRRRLREAVRVHLCNELSDGVDYVIIAHRACLTVDFTVLTSELRRLVGQSKQESKATLT